MAYDETGDKGVNTPLMQAVEKMFASKARPNREMLRALCNVAWQAEYYRAKAPILAGVNLVEALDDLAAALDTSARGS